MATDKSARRWTDRAFPPLVAPGDKPKAVAASAEAQRGEFVSQPRHADIAAIVVTYNNARDIQQLIDSLRVAARAVSVRLYVVDNGSVDGTVSVVNTDCDITVLESGGNIGYAAAINMALPLLGDCDHVLILNPDLIVTPDAITNMIAGVKSRDIGAVVPLVVDDSGDVYPSIFREPSVMRSLCDALLTRRVCARFGIPSESDLHASSYRAPHDVDGAMGCALLITIDAARQAGNWSEEFFLYSEEVDYFRRIRAQGRRVVFEPSAVVMHRGGGSGKNTELQVLMAANRVRYVRMHHGLIYTAAYRFTVFLRHLLRARDSADRQILKAMLTRNHDARSAFHVRT